VAVSTQALEVGSTRGPLGEPILALQTIPIRTHIVDLGVPA
jgi:hypothetical protein